MLSWIFEVAQTEPSFLIGGIAENFNRSFQLGSGRHFIIEGDEYDTAFFDKGPKFLHYFPDSIILTSVEFDHADIYKDLDAVENSFKRLVNLVPRRGRIVAFDTGTSIESCVARAFCAVHRYGKRAESAWRIERLTFNADSTSWSLLRNGKLWAQLEFPLAGEYNVWNASAAAAMAANYGISAKVVADALARFQSVKRRLEVTAEINGITIIDDFAHHPTAIAETLKALRARYAGRRLWAILEPRSNTLRRNVFQDDLAKSLAVADEVVIANVFKSDSIPERERLDVAAVAAQLSRDRHHARVLADVDSIVKICAPEMRAGDVIGILSNGGFGGIYEKLPQKLRSLSLKSNAVEAKS